MLARGEYDVASLRLGHVLQSRSTGVPFVAVATLNQRQLGAVITTPATGISRFADLEGKTVARPRPLLASFTKYARLWPRMGETPP